MKIWVRSQDKEDLVKSKNIGLAYLGKYGFIDKIGDIERKKFYICEFTDTTHTTLGKYKTKERALEVLNQIQERLLNLQLVELEEKGKARNDVYTRPYLECVFSMPKE